MIAILALKSSGASNASMFSDDPAGAMFKRQRITGILLNIDNHKQAL
ncbi:hypothetical protein [Marinobacter sp. F3R11]|nr:hypothetical protein [Marinobacter sp. F3R11]